MAQQNQRHSIGQWSPHPDLPTITEALESEEDTAFISEGVGEDNESDPGSKISYDNSCSFTLDGVGFDEENSFISGICSGSVVDTHYSTPPSDGGGLNRLEMRETCRRLRIPWSDNNSYLGSDNCGGGETTEASVLERGSANGEKKAMQKKCRRKVSWPWSEFRGGVSISPTLNSLDNARDCELPNASVAKKCRKIDDEWRTIKNNAALSKTIALIAICMIGILVTAFTSRSGQSNNLNSVEAEVVVIEGEPRPLPVTIDNNVDGSDGGDASTTAAETQSNVATETDVVESPSRVSDGEEEDSDCIINTCKLELSPTCSLKYKVNVPTITNPINSASMELTCDGESWVAIGFSNDGQMVGSEAVVGVPGCIPQKYEMSGKDNNSVMPMAASKQTLMDASVKLEGGMTVLKFTKMMSEEGEVEIRPGENIFLYAQGRDSTLGYHATGESFTLTLPDFEEADIFIADSTTIWAPPTKDILIESTTGLDDLSSCVDQPGKFATSNNKNRACKWLATSDTLNSPLLDQECGSQAFSNHPSELGLNCRYSCRAYNGCLQQDAGNLATTEVDRVQPSTIGEMNDGEEAWTPPQTSSIAPCTTEMCELELSPTCSLKYKVNVPTITNPINSASMELTCDGESWVAIGFSNDGQMVGSEAVVGVPGCIPQKYEMSGKDNNSVMPMAASKQTLMDASVKLEGGMTVLKFTKMMSEEGEVEIRPGENIFLYAQGMGVDLGYHIIRGLFTLNLPVLEKAEIATLEVPVVGDNDCSDSVGYFLDSNSTLRECNWLNEQENPFDETRKIYNCGYLKEPTELGRMCKSSCGVCDG